MHLEVYGDTLRFRIALWTLLIVVWFVVWFWRFHRDWRQGDNGSTAALWFFFLVMAIKNGWEAFGFFYLISPWVTHLASDIILQIREFINVAVLVSLAVLQWRFTTNGTDKNDS